MAKGTDWILKNMDWDYINKQSREGKLKNPVTLYLPAPSYISGASRPKQPRLTKPKTWEELQAGNKMGNIGYIDKGGNLVAAPSSEPVMPSAFSSPLAHERAMGANVGDVRDFGGQKMRWNGVVWEPVMSADQQRAQRMAEQRAKIGKESAFFSGLKSLAPTFDTRKVGADIANIGRGISGTIGKTGLVGPLSGTSNNYQDSLRKLAGGAVGALGTLGTGFLGGPLTSAARAIRSKVDTGYHPSQNPFEFGVSEAIASERIDKGKGAILAGSDVKQGIKEDNVKRQSFWWENPAKAIQDEQNELNDLGAEVEATTGGMVDEDTWGLITQAQETLADAQAKLEAGGELEIEQLEEFERQKRAAIESAYDTLIKAREQDIPEATARKEALVKRLRDYIESAGTDVETANVDVANRAEAAVRQRYANQEEQSRQLRNLFSGLGTAESSSFIQELGKLTRGAETDVTQLEKSKVDAIAANNREYLKLKDEAENDITDLENQLTEAVNEINNSIDMSKLEKNEAILELWSQVEQQKASIREQLNNAAVAFAQAELQGKYGLANTLLSGQLANQNLIDQYNLEAGAYAPPSVSPEETPGYQGYTMPTNKREQEVFDRIEVWFRQVGNADPGGVRTKQFAETLKRQYPDLKSYIDRCIAKDYFRELP